MVILGFPKCGQNSLAKYLDCKLHDFVYYQNAVEIYLKNYSGKRPVFITRDPEQRMRSQYHYLVRYKNNGLSYEDFKNYIDPDPAWGGITPVEQCNYEYFINQFKAYNPLVFRLEDMGSLMPKKNVNTNYAT